MNTTMDNFTFTEWVHIVDSKEESTNKGIKSTKGAVFEVLQDESFVSANRCKPVSYTFRHYQNPTSKKPLSDHEG